VWKVTPDGNTGTRSSCSNEAENRAEKEAKWGKETMCKALFSVLKITSQEKLLEAV
jgi:hypothetical protein